MKIILFIIVAILAAAFAGQANAASVSLAPRLSIYADEKENPLKNPEGVACFDKGAVVADTGNGRLVKLIYDDTGLKPGGEIKLPQVTYPTRVQADADGSLLVLDGRSRKVARVGASGEFKGFIEPQGVPGQSALSPSGFRADAAGNIYLADAASGSVVVLDSSGRYVRDIAYPKGAGFVADVLVDAKGTVYILDAPNSQVYSAEKGAKEFAPFTKDLKDYASYPVTMTMDERGFIYLVDAHGGGIIVLGQDGSFQGRQLSLGWNEGALYYPEQMCISPKGAAFIADRGNNRVGVFSVVH